MTKKRRNISGLTGVELAQAMSSISALLQKLETDKQLGTSDAIRLNVTIDEDKVTALQEIYDELAKCANSPQVCNRRDVHSFLRYFQQNISFSSMTQARLAAFGIEPAKEVAELRLKSNLSAVLTETDKLGEGKHWSADGLFAHLQLLEEIVPRKVNFIWCQRVSLFAYFILRRMKLPLVYGSMPFSTASPQSSRRRGN